MVVASALAALAVAAAGVMLMGTSTAQAAAPAAAQQQEEEKGVLIARVEATGPAARAGLRRGDIVLKLADTEVNSVGEVADFLANRKPGDSVAVVVQRGDDERAFTVTLGDQDGRAYLGVSFAGGNGLSLPGRPGGPQLEVKPGVEARKIVTEVHMGVGAVIVEVLTGTPASKAGLVAGDVISTVNGVSVDISNTLSVLIGQHEPGDAVTLGVANKSGVSRTVQVTLGANPDDSTKPYLGVQYTFTGPMFSWRGRMPSMPSMPSMPGKPLMPRMPGPGMSISAEITIRNVVTGSPAATAGLKVNDVIVSLDGAAVTDPRAVVETIAQHKPGDTIKLQVKRGDTTTDVSVTLGENPDKEGAAYLGVSLSATMRMRTPPGDGQSGWSLPDDFFGMMPGLPDLFDQLPQIPMEKQPAAGQSL